MHREPDHVAIDVGEVERIAALGWRGLDEARLGDWLLRAAGGFTGRSNSALALGSRPAGRPSGVGRHDELDEIVRWYAERGLPPMAQVSLSEDDGIDAWLAGAGWRAHDLVCFLTGDIAEVGQLTAALSGGLLANRQEAAAPAVTAPVITRLDTEPDEPWLAGYHYRGSALPAHARDVLCRTNGRAQLCFASHRAADSEPNVLAVARGALAQGWLGVTAVTVADRHRRRGHATRLMLELTGWAAERGARSIYLQVAADNRPALELYQRLGFHHHHNYRYRLGPAPGGTGSRPKGIR